MRNPKKKIVIISENLLQELNVRVNDGGHCSANSKVFLGDKWVKKIPISGQYSNKELTQYEIMAKHSDIFPKTKILKYPGCRTLILQQKLNVAAQEEIYEQVEKKFAYKLVDLTFRTLLERIAQSGLTLEYKSKVDTIFKDMKDKNVSPNIINRFSEYVFLANNLYHLTKQYKQFLPYQMDLHDRNMGLDENGEIKIFDFISNRPRL